jgi:hypothetical protein
MQFSYRVPLELINHVFDNHSKQFPETINTLGVLYVIIDTEQ